MTRLNSTSIYAADYDAAHRLLYIWFINRGPYTYYNVPESIFLGLINASSAGTYYNLNIRGKYSAEP